MLFLCVLENTLRFLNLLGIFSIVQRSIICYCGTQRHFNRKVFIRMQHCTVMVMFKEVETAQKSLWLLYIRKRDSLSIEDRTKIEMHLKNIAEVLFNNIDTIAHIVSLIDWKKKSGVIVNCVLRTKFLRAGLTRGLNLLHNSVLIIFYAYNSLFLSFIKPFSSKKSCFY